MSQCMHLGCQARATRGISWRTCHAHDLTCAICDAQLTIATPEGPLCRAHEAVLAKDWRGYPVSGAIADFIESQRR